MATAATTITVDIPGIDTLNAALRTLADAATSRPDSAAAVAIRAIQLMNEAGRQRDEHKATLDRVQAAIEAAKERGATGREFYDDVTAALAAAPVVGEQPHA